MRASWGLSGLLGRVGKGEGGGGCLGAIPGRGLDASPWLLPAGLFPLLGCSWATLEAPKAAPGGGRGGGGLLGGLWGCLGALEARKAESAATFRTFSSGLCVLCLGALFVSRRAMLGRPVLGDARNVF